MVTLFPVLTPGRVLKLLGAGLLALTLTAAFVFRDGVLRSSLDPKQPFQTYMPPAAPDYRTRSAWALLPPYPLHPGRADGPADVFFVHPTTYNGGEEWNGPIDHPRSARQLAEVMIPNYAGPFLRVGRVFAPRYRQASLYGVMSLREDAQDARRFAYEDVRRAFRYYLATANKGRPLVLVGVEQGGAIAARLLRDEIAPDPTLSGRLAAAYLIRTVVPAGPGGTGVRPCTMRGEPRCVVAYMPVEDRDPAAGRRILRRALVWGDAGDLEWLGGRPALCVNPVLGRTGNELAGKRDNLGAANATDLEWGVRPAFLPRQVTARCSGGLLLVSRPKSPTLKTAGGWADQLKAPGYNLFYADLEADALARVKALRSAPDFRIPAPPITASVAVRRVPLMGR